MHPGLSDSELLFAERVLFGTENVFDDQRRLFIENYDTIDVLAVPGSGKTTALLAKLIILSRFQQTNNCGGILVLSHTNAAVDLIKEKIGKQCPNLFNFPNFTGTIQRFVDTFLAIPFFEVKYGFRPDNIESEAFKSKIEKAYDFFLQPPGFSIAESNNARWFLNRNEGLLSNYRLGLDLSGNYEIYNGLNAQPLIISKPRNKFQVNYNDFTVSEKSRIKEWLIKFKILFWKRFRTIHYEDAYFFSSLYIKQCPSILNIIANRFRFVFVDEMQDMDVHQIGLLDKLFYQNPIVQTFQRIGDKNQSIFSHEVKLEEVWQERSTVLTLTNSMRLSALNAARVQPFALNPIPLVGENHVSNSKEIKPRIISFSENNISSVLTRFAEIIKLLQESAAIPLNPKHPFKVIGWRKYSDDPARKTIIKSYFENYNQDKGKSAIERALLCDYFGCCKSESLSSGNTVKVIINALLKVFSLQNIQTDSGPYNRFKIENHLSTKCPSFYPKYRLLLFKVCKLLMLKEFLTAQVLFKEFAIETVQNISLHTTLSAETMKFIDTPTDGSIAIVEPAKEENIVEYQGIKLYVDTVHGVKGETHCATLYLETFFQADGKKSFESQRLIDQLLGIQILPTAGRRTQQSAKIVYVGFSRPTHLLCVAIRADRISGRENALRDAGWEIDDRLS